MKRLNQLSERDFLSLFFAAFSMSFLIAAFCMPDRANMLPGLLRIVSSPTLSSTNFFSLGGYAATFLNMGLVGVIMVILFAVFGAKPNNASTLAFILLISSWVR